MSEHNVARLNKFVDILRKDTSIKIAYKNKSYLMKLIGMLLFFNKTFMTHFITTIFHTIYFPNKLQYVRNPAGSMITVSHEYAHIKCSKKMLYLPYIFLYLCPQILVLAAIPGAFFVGWWSLLAIVFLLPLPAYWRMKIEIEGYAVGLFTLYHILLEGGLDQAKAIKRLKDQASEINRLNFQGSSYYYMWMFGVQGQLDKVIDSIVSNQIMKTNDIYSQVKGAIKASTS